MIAKEVKRRTDKVHKEMDEVIVNGGPLSAVAQGVQAVNVTLAHHAAYTEERFERVEDRLESLELGQHAIVESINGLNTRVGNLETAHVAMHAEMGRMEARLTGKIDGLAGRVDGLAGTVNGLAGRVDGLAGTVNGLAGRVDGLAGTVNGLVGTIDGLTVRMDKVLAFAIKDELKLAEIMKEGHEES
jgi:hypothetical protein